MQNYLYELRNFFRKGDVILLLMCLVATAFGCLVICSATNAVGFTRYLIIQLVATALGVLLYAMISSIDAEVLSEHRRLLAGVAVFLLALLIPFGTDNGTGNRSWLNLPLVPFNIQPAEICKIFFILVLASVMSARQNRPSHIMSIFHGLFYLVVIVGVNYVLSKDAGVSLIFVFIYIGMVFSGGVKLLWFLIGGGSIVLAAPVLWNYVFSEFQRNRIRILFDPTIDPTGINERYHTMQSLRSLTGGGLTGQGLFNGIRTQSDSLYAQHTDYIFSAIGEELGFVGCIFTVAMLVAIIARCIYVGVRSPDYMRRMICFGSAAALIFQVISNVGMCIGITPVIGLTLPFISYGGSSILSLYAMLGLVSGVHARPTSVSHERYIRPPLKRR